MDTGRLRLGLSMLGSWARARHEGRAGDGLPGTEHRIDAGWVQANLDVQLALLPRFAIDLGMPLRLTMLDVSARADDGTALRVEDTIHRSQRLFSQGDTLLALRWGLVRTDDVRGWTLDLQTGASVPTGVVRPDPYSPDNPEGVEKLSHGSGTLDPYVGLSTNYNAGRWGVLAWTDARVPVVTNRYGNRASRVVQAGAGAFTGFGLVKWRFAATHEVFYASAVRWRDLEAPSTQRTSLILGVAAYYQPRPRLGVNATLKVPYFNGAQRGSWIWPAIVGVGINYTFLLVPEEKHHH